MTAHVTISTLVQCDSCHVWQTVDEDESDTRSILRLAGWVMTATGRDYCQRCARERLYVVT